MNVRKRAQKNNLLFDFNFVCKTARCAVQCFSTQKYDAQIIVRKNAPCRRKTRVTME
jgi:hypothetical protein